MFVLKLFASGADSCQLLRDTNPTARNRHQSICAALMLAFCCRSVILYSPCTVLHCGDFVGVQAASALSSFFLLCFVLAKPQVTVCQGYLLAHVGLNRQNMAFVKTENSRNCTTFTRKSQKAFLGKIVLILRTRTLIRDIFKTSISSLLSLLPRMCAGNLMWTSSTQSRKGL